MEEEKYEGVTHNKEGFHNSIHHNKWI